MNHTLLLELAVTLALASSAAAGGAGPDGFVRVRDAAAAPFVLVEQGHPSAEIVVASQSELIRNAVDWISAFARDRTGARLKLVNAAKAGSRQVVVAVGNDPGLADLRAAGLELDPRVSPEGFVLQRVSAAAHGAALVCWSPVELSCRYGLIELLRTLQVCGQNVTTSVARVADRRREELALGCCAGGICYTMAPQLQCLSIFCCAEA